MKTKIGMFAMLLIGLLSGYILSSTSDVSASEPKTIKVQRVDVNLVINGMNSPERPVIINGGSYLPVRTIAEVFNCDVDWDMGSRTVTVTQRTYEDEK